MFLLRCKASASSKNKEMTYDNNRRATGELLANTENRTNGFMFTGGFTTCIPAVYFAINLRIANPVFLKIDKSKHNSEHIIIIDRNSSCTICPH